MELSCINRHFNISIEVEQRSVYEKGVEAIHLNPMVWNKPTAVPSRKRKA